MEYFERIIVCIDEPERDTAMVDFSRSIVAYARSKQITLLHVINSPLPREISVPQGFPPPDIRQLERELEEKVASKRGELIALKERWFGGFDDDDCRCEVTIGSPLLEILRVCNRDNSDLVIVGRHYGDKTAHGNKALLARRVTSKSSCSVLTVPEFFQTQVRRVLVPARDSECSANALEVGCAIAESIGAEVVPLNVFQVHGGYSSIGVTYDEHEGMLEAIAKQECEHLVERSDTRSVAVRSLCMPDPYGMPVQVIARTVIELPVDLVVIGARGRTGAAGVLLGAITEQLIGESPVPVLAVKKKGEVLGVLRAIMSIAGE